MPKKRKSNDNEIPETVIDAMGVNTNVDNSGEDPEIQTLVTKRTRKICQAPDCTTFARSAGYCIAHGGGKLCQAPDCTTNVVYGGLKGYCQKHGGGYRCQVPNCTSGAEAGGLLKGYCYAHGGGKRKLDDEKTVAKRKRKICQAPDCTTNAVYGGLKGYCQKHGGGYRCQSPGCTSGAEAGGLMKGFCYAHGGGKRKTK